MLRTPLLQGQREAVCHHVVWMLDHLHHHHVGEDEGVWPRTLAKRPDDDCAYLEKHHLRAGLSLPQEAQMFMWLLDDLDERRATIAKSQLPRPELWALSAILGSSCDRGAAQRWGRLAGQRF